MSILSGLEHVAGDVVGGVGHGAEWVYNALTSAAPPTSGMGPAYVPPSTTPPNPADPNFQAGLILGALGGLPNTQTQTNATAQTQNPQLQLLLALLQAANQTPGGNPRP